MGDAYLEYDPITGAIAGVHWNQPIDSWIKIDEDLAISFMDGSKKIHLHKVIIDGSGSPFLKVFKEDLITPVFNETLLDGVSNKVKIKINKSSVTVTIVHDISNNVGLFVTLKNDPTWLIESFNITRLSERSGKKSMNIKIPNATSYSYHIGVIDEVQAI